MDADERLAHEVFGEEERGENVVLLPSVIVAKVEFGVRGTKLLNLVAANVRDVGDAILSKSLNGPVDNAHAADFGKAFRGVGGGGHQPAAPAGADDNGTHGNQVPSERDEKRPVS